MRETRAVPTPHKSPVCCPIWLAGFPPKISTAAAAASQARAGKAHPGEVGGSGALESPSLAPCLAQRPPSSLSALPAQGRSPSSSLPPPGCPSSSPLLCLTQKASKGEDLPGGSPPSPPPPSSMATTKGRPTGLPRLPLECSP